MGLDGIVQQGRTTANTTMRTIDTGQTWTTMQTKEKRMSKKQERRVPVGKTDWTITLETRLRPQTLAEVYTWLDSVGMRTTSKSGLIRLGLEALAEMLVNAGKAQRFEFTEEALDFLDAVGIDGLNRYGKMTKKLHTTLGEESLKQFERDRSNCTAAFNVPEPLAGALFDHKGWLLHTTVLKLAELGYQDIDNTGSTLPPGVMDILRRGQLPPKIEKLTEELNKIETPEEAHERREAEFRAQQARMRAEMLAKRKEAENENV